MKILILEDEAPAARRLVRMVETLRPGYTILGTAAGIAEGLDLLTRGPAPDLVLSDIELTDGQSFEFFHRSGLACPVIYITAYDEFALRAFEANGVGYLLKPITEQALEKALTRLETLGRPAAEQSQLQLLARLIQAGTGTPATRRTRFLVPIGDRYQVLAVKDIAYLHSQGGQTRAYTSTQKSWPIPHTLDELEAELPPERFFRLNRQILASAPAVQGIFAHFNGKLKLTLAPATQEEVFVSRDKAQAFKTWMTGE